MLTPAEEFRGAVKLVIILAILLGTAYYISRLPATSGIRAQGSSYSK